MLRGRPKTPPSGDDLAVLDYHLKGLVYVVVQPIYVFAVGDLTKTAMDGVGFMRSEHQPAKDKMPYIQFITAVAVPGLDHTMTGLIKEVNDARQLALIFFCLHHVKVDILCICWY